MIPGLASILHAAANQGKTYADFEAWALAQSATNLGQQSGTGSSATRLYRILLGATFSGNMFGSPWGPSAPSYGSVSTDSRANRIAQHSFLSETAATANLGRYVLLRAANNGTSVFFGQDRNGYPSLTYTDANEAAFTVDRFDYFDDASGKIVRVNPNAQTFEMVDF